MTLKVDIHKHLRGFSLHVSFETDGQRLGILGPSGSGKTMTLKMIAGIERPDYGSIELNGRTLFDSKKNIDVSPQQRHVGYLFQQYALFPNMTVLQNINCGLVGVPKKNRTETVQKMVSRFQLTGMENRYPNQLSGGQQQRVALARCLASEPELILLDEPFSALDAFLREQVILEMKDFLEKYSGESIMVSHNRDEIFVLCPRLLVLNRGCAIGQGATTDLFHRPQSVQVAQLTGCKNISPVNRIAEDTLYASNWHLTLKYSAPIPDDITHVGIRAHDLRPVINGQTGENLFLGTIVGIQEGLFETTILIGTFPETNQPLWWKVEKSLWAGNYQKYRPTHFMISPENIMLLVDDKMRHMLTGGLDETNKND